MTVLARSESKRFVPSCKTLSMSYEDTLREMEAFLDGKLDNPQSGLEVYADVTEPVNPSAFRLPNSADPDATESSSSFGDTMSRSEIGSGASDAEVESEYRVDSGLDSMFDSYATVFPMRKKKLTNHWRSFIRPLMWRCKWTELKIKELESQAQKYGREIEAIDQSKMLEAHQNRSDFCSRSHPFAGHSIKRKLMKRRKRKLLENVTDISSYICHHHIFSYLEKKKSDPDGVSTAEDANNIELECKNDEIGMDSDWLLNDDEDSFGQILRQIEKVQSQVHTLRNHLDMVMLKNGVKLSSSEDLSLFATYDAQNSAAQSPVFSAGNGDNLSIGAMPTASNLSDFEIDDLVLPDSIISGYGDGTEIPDIIESTVGLLSGADVTIHQQQLVESGDNILDNARIQSIDRNISCGSIGQLTVGYRELNNNNQKPSSLLAGTGSEPDPMIVAPIAQSKSLNSCWTSDARVPMLKRKRGERKAGPGGWNLKCPGEPDSN